MFTLPASIPRASPAPPHSKPGAFIAQIAAMNRAFARGNMVIVMRMPSAARLSC